MARETILADKSKNAPASVDFSRFEPRKADPTSPPSTVDPGEVKDSQDLMLTDNGAETQVKMLHEESTIKAPGIITTTINSAGPKLVETQKPITAAGWLEWLGIANVENKARSELSQPQASNSHTVETNAGNPMEQQHSAASLIDQPILEPTTLPSSRGEITTVAPASTSSWFNIWLGSASNNKTTDATPASDPQIDSSTEAAPATETPIVVDSKRPLPGSTWAFWSKDSRRPFEKGAEAEERGELAVAGEATQNNPAPARAVVFEGDNGDRVKKTNKRGRQLLDDVQEPAPKALHSDVSNKRL